MDKRLFSNWCQGWQADSSTIVVEIPSFFIHPLVPSVVHKPPVGNLVDMSHYRTWQLSSKDLQTVLDLLYESLEPQTDRIIGNTHMLLSIKNPDALPYQHLDGAKEFFIKDLPNSLIPKEKYSANDSYLVTFAEWKLNSVKWKPCWASYTLWSSWSWGQKNWKVLGMEK